MEYLFHESHDTDNKVMELSIFDTGPDGHDVIVIGVKTNHNPDIPGQGYASFSMQLAPQDVEWLAEALLDTLDKRERKNNE